MWIRKNKKIYINLLDYKVYDLLQNLKYTFRFKEKVLTCKIQIKYWKKPNKKRRKKQTKNTCTEQQSLATECWSHEQPSHGPSSHVNQFQWNNFWIKQKPFLQSRSRGIF